VVVGLLADALSLSVDRSATIRTDLQDCEFLVIEKDDFDRVLKSLLFDALASKVEKMKKFKLFEQMSDVHLKKIALHLERRVVPPKTRAYFGRNQHGLVGDSLTTSVVLVKQFWPKKAIQRCTSTFCSRDQPKLPNLSQRRRTSRAICASVSLRLTSKCQS